MDGKANTADLLLAWITELDPRVTLTTAIDASFTDDGDSQYVLAGVDVTLSDGVDLKTQRTCCDSPRKASWAACCKPP
jgi:hypothetical protein